PAWPRAPKVSPGDVSERIIASEGASSTHQEQSPETPTGERISRSVLAACEALLGAEEQLTELDRIAGDGDLGGNMARAARSIKERMGAYSFDHPPQALRELGLSLQQLLGGSSGPLYGVFFLR